MTAKFDTIGIDYNATRKADPYLFQQLLSHLNAKKEDVYLYIGCATGKILMFLKLYENTTGIFYSLLADRNMGNHKMSCTYIYL